MALLALLKVLNFNFGKFEPFLKSQIVKIAIFEIQILSKMFSRKIEWQIPKFLYCGP